MAGGGGGGGGTYVPSLNCKIHHFAFLLRRKPVGILLLFVIAVAFPTHLFVSFSYHFSCH